jgi:ADP-ribose pyrophosphatase YjhB (NUDIX family)
MLLLRILPSFFAHSRHIPRPSGIDYKIDVYEAIHLTLNNVVSEAEFKAYIDKVVETESQSQNSRDEQGKANAVWVHILSMQFSLATYLCSAGFRIQYGVGEKLVLTKWIGKIKNMIIPYSAAYMSAGAIIIKANQILLVQEKTGFRKQQFGIPSGRSNFGESIDQCAERELLEETNIKAKFSYILHFRELEKMAYGGMDFYFACVMDFEDSALAQLRIDEVELDGFKWVHLDNYE